MTELAETLGTTPEQIALAIRATLPTLSLTPVDDEDGLREFDVPVESLIDDDLRRIYKSRK